MRALIVLGAALIVGAGWPTAAHDARRTGQSDVLGPRAASAVTSIVLTNEQAVNMPVTIADDGTLFAGTWGVVRSGGASQGTAWNKFDGKLYALDRALGSRWTAPLDATPYCYLFGGRAPTASWCSSAGTGTINGYNGTVEGVAALDAARGRVYVGRGDGKLYALDAATGAVAWRFATFNPLARDDPEGGGEIVAGPLVAANGTVYFATVAVGAYETNAVYAVAADGTMLWRVAIPYVVWAPPALSPDGKTLYVGAGWGPSADHWDTSLAGSLYALNAADGATKWVFKPINDAEFWKPTVWTTRIAVGADGTIYASGTELTAGGGSAVLFALRDEGSGASYAWPRMVDLDRDRAAVSFGLALREVAGRTTRVYATSGNVFNELLGGYKAGGKLVAVDAPTGSVLWTFDPETVGGIGSMTGIAIDASGVVFTGVSGAKDSGRVFALRDDGALLWQITLGGLLEWSHPVLGPRGDLYVADTRRCALNALPIESGVCNAVNVSPRIYAVLNGGRRRAAKH